MTRGARYTRRQGACVEPSMLSTGGYTFASCDVAFVAAVRSTARCHYFQIGLRSGQKIFVSHASIDAANDAYGRFNSELHQALGL